MTPLPVEIVERIFKDLHSNDYEGLKRCSLACNAFLRLARTYLFRNVTISVIPDELAATPDLLSTSPSTTTPTFLSFLASDLHVASNIRYLQIQNARTSYSDSQRRWREAAFLLTQLRLKATSIHRLSIHSSLISDWTMEDQALRLSLIQFWELPTFHDLHLYYVTLSRQDLLGFTRVPKLTLVGTRPVPEYPWVAFRDISPAGDTENANVIMLQDLCIVLRNAELAKDMYTVVLAASKTLKYLRWLASPYYDAQDTCLHIIDLQTFPYLTLLAISFPLDGDKSLSNLARLFKGHVGRSALKIVEILCDYDGSQRIPDDSPLNVSPNWQILDETLISAAYTALEEVRIGVKERKRVGLSMRTSEDQEHIRSHESFTLFQRHLPRAYSQGVIVAYKEAVSKSRYSGK